MEKKIIIDAIKALWCKFIAYVKSETIKESFKKAVDSFKEVLWNGIKEEVYKTAEDLIKDTEDFINSEEAKAKEEELINTIINKIKLPVIAKPFKGLIKKIIKNKIEDIIAELLEKAKAVIQK